MKNLLHRKVSHEQKLEKLEQELHKKKTELCELLPIQFQAQFLSTSYIAGGCLYSIYNNQEPKDYDFLLESETLGSELTEYFMSIAGYHGKGISGGTYKNLQLLITDNAISIGKFQIITRFKGSPEETIDQFDFMHNFFYYRYGKVIALTDFKYLRGKELVYNTKRARDIVGTLMRVPRFVSRGMQVKQKELAKMLLKLHEVGFNERELEILRDSENDKHFGS